MVTALILSREGGMVEARAEARMEGGAMPGRVAVTLALLLAGCGSVEANRPATLNLPGEAMEVAVGGQMVDRSSTTVTVTPMQPRPRVVGFRAEFVYLGLLGSDPAGRSTIRVRYAEHKIAGGVEIEPPEYRAEVTLDLARSRIIEFRGWRIGVLDATDSTIKYEVVGIPAP
jgi:hypothetical protein